VRDAEELESPALDHGRPFSSFAWQATVFGSLVLSSNTSIATASPSLHAALRRMSAEYDDALHQRVIQRWVNYHE